MKQFDWSVVCELVCIEEVQVRLKGHVVKKGSVGDSMVTLRLFRFNAGSLPDDRLTGTNIKNSN